MKRYLPLSLLVLIAATVSALAVNTIFGYVKATPKDDDIMIQWRSLTETGVHSYNIERNSEDVPEFRQLGRVSAKGGANNTYTFTDNGAFFKPQGGKRFTYRVKAVGANIEQYSPATSVVHEVSSVRRSWGMIKELFR